MHKLTGDKARHHLPVEDMLLERGIRVVMKKNVQGSGPAIAECIRDSSSLRTLLRMPLDETELVVRIIVRITSLFSTGIQPVVTRHFFLAAILNILRLGVQPVLRGGMG